MNNKRINNFIESNYSVLILIIIHFFINIFIYFNTNSFYEISESGSIFDAYYSLIKGENISLIYGNFFLTPAFIAFFIHKLTGGGLFYYFIFQIALSTLTVFIIYNIILRITSSKKKAIIGLILLIFYIEYNLLSAIFYNQLYEIFFMSLFLLTVVVFNDEKQIINLVKYTLLLLGIIFMSLFFRFTLIFIYTLFIFLLLIYIKNKINLLKFSILTILSFIICFTYNPYKIFNYSSTSNINNAPVLLFWGHTLYGGLGGENGFIFPENENRYNVKLKEYINVNKIDTLTADDINRFQLTEVKEFIKNEPHKWLLLQFRKLFYTFGSVPQKDGLLMLYQGKIHMSWLVSSLIIQIPYAVILFMFLLCVDLNFKDIILHSYKRIVYFLGLYLIFGICIAGPYQERYRLVVFVCFFIPVIAINFDKFKTILFKENRKELITKLVIIFILLTVWIYQAYEALYIYHDRYFKVVQ